MKSLNNNSKRGFTLIETLVALGVFSVVAVMAIGALLVVQTSSRKAQATRSIVDNLGFSLDDMVRTAQAGSGFDCDGCAPTIAGTLFTLKDVDNQAVQYELDTAVGRIKKTVDGVSSYVTQPNINITGLSFYKYDQSSVVRMGIVVQAKIGGTTKYADTIHLHTSVTQRL